MGLRRVLRLYRIHLSLQLRARLAYKGDFILGVCGATLLNLVTFIFITTIFGQISYLQGWTLWEIILLYSLIVTAEGVNQLLCEGAWGIPLMVSERRPDTWLTRPVPLFMQVSTSWLSSFGFANVPLGALLFIQGVRHTDIHWTPVKIAAAPLVCLSGIAVMTALITMVNTGGFWLNPTTSGRLGTVLAMTAQLARYPIVIYGTVVQVLLATVLPFAFASYYPVAFLLDKPGGLIGLATPAVALAAWTTSWLLVRRGLLRYQTIG